MGRKIDIRIMKLNKWYVPKTYDWNSSDTPMVLGYFDALEVHELQIDTEKCHPFTGGYRELIRQKIFTKEELTDYSSQEQILFLNICESDSADGSGFAENTVQSFWEDKNSPYVFVSMIHINHSNKLNLALKKIREVFQNNYLSYISFDYCDIVIFAKNMQIREFESKVKRLFETNPENIKIFFDTYSLVSFYPSAVSNPIWQEQAENADYLAEKIHVTINLSIKNYKKYKAWYTKECNDSQGLFFGSEIGRYSLFGRYDISIINPNADIEWLIKTLKMLHEEEQQKIFWTFETYVKIPENDVDSFFDEDDGPNPLYQNVKKALKDAITELEKAMEGSGFPDKTRYMLPVYEARDCICSIAKNRFAEEFVYCIYESFLHFVSYMEREFNKPEIREDDIAEGYDKYFTALNTLVNSTMHSEKQFIQATAFNAIFYSIPPKIMALYNAYTYRIRQILKDENSVKKYTFLIYPSFSPEISIDQISLAEDPPCDRILAVTINEESLYDIESVMYILVHELAHYVGNGQRCRLARKERIMHTLLKHIEAKCKIDQETCRILQGFVYDSIECNTDKDGGFLERYNYLLYLNEAGHWLLNKLATPEESRAYFESYYQKEIEKDSFQSDGLLEDFGVEQRLQKAYIKTHLQQYCKTKYDDYIDLLEEILGQDDMEEYDKTLELLHMVYSECYADLQMILVLAMGAEDYLNTFHVKLGMPIWEIVSREDDMIRISTIFRVMINCGLWKVPNEQDTETFRTAYGLIDAYNTDVQKDTEAELSSQAEQAVTEIQGLAQNYNFENGIQLLHNVVAQNNIPVATSEETREIVPLVHIAADLYVYLLAVMKASLEEYAKPDKLLSICEVREVVRKLLAFESAAEVFDCVESELDYYKEKGCGI